LNATVAVPFFSRGSQCQFPLFLVQDLEDFVGPFALKPVDVAGQALTPAAGR